MRKLQAAPRKRLNFLKTCQPQACQGSREGGGWVPRAPAPHPARQAPGPASTCTSLLAKRCHDSAAEVIN
ncbi:unnamed protein product [Rangifer tarandus platyrhynchus]|uniref:Uncharacterized protein n=3 Tax=Rangifer tarandus platyrhynchus TaxID=3082113 RepID=A0ABN8XQ48_RANTA|nr:unnamed protein product [Rangifer tarandus platyrhynchus]CAI9691550.1 unnamed protein product [Rangifer tarandus platyrhynchus]